MAHCIGIIGKKCRRKIAVNISTKNQPCAA
jgi:hypothetical protein